MAQTMNVSEQLLAFLLFFFKKKFLARQGWKGWGERKNGILTAAGDWRSFVERAANEEKQRNLNYKWRLGGNHQRNELCLLFFA